MLTRRSVKERAATSPGEDGGGSIRVVSMRTGLAMETLRAWERRYGFPTPERRKGSNRRLYSGSDVERLLLIRRAIEHGYRIGDVVDKGTAELEALASGAPVAAHGVARDASPSPTAPESDVDALVELLANDRVSSIEVELRRAAIALGPRRFVTDVAHPFALKVGDAWASGRLSVRHEHLATECLVTQIRQMLAGYQDIQGHPTVLLATLPGEPHTLALQMIALYLVVGGARPRLLGGPTPVQEIVGAARVFRADVIGITVTPASDRKETRKAVIALRRSIPPRVPIWIGGGGASSLAIDDARTKVVESFDAVDRAMVAARAGALRGSAW